MKGEELIIDSEDFIKVVESIEELGFSGPRSGSKHKGSHHLLLDKEDYKIKLSLHKDVEKWGGYGNYEPHYSTNPDKNVWRLVKRKIEEDFELIK